MRNFFKIAATIVAMVAMVLTAHAGETKGFKSVKTKAAFDDVFIGLQDAVIGKGYNIDYVGHMNTMLNRTSKAVGSVTEKGSTSPYVNAKFMNFCSAKLTHEAVSANPQNIAICPYVVFIYEEKAEPGVIHVGYRRPVAGPSKRTRKAFDKIEAMLTDVINEAIK